MDIFLCIHILMIYSFNWLPTEGDYKSYYKAAKEAKAQNNPQILTDWEPRWYVYMIFDILDKIYIYIICRYPHLEFQNMIEEHTREWELYPEEGFRIQNFKDFAQVKGRN